jgi:hypothetical protein
MKRAFLLIVVPALLVALAFAQTPAASINTDQAIKGCLGGSDGNYTVVEDGTGHIFKITTNSVDLKQHLGHDVTLIGHRASGASSGAADNSFAVTELNMISEHCAAAAAAPTATVSTPSETTVTPDAAATAPAATISTVPETAVTPAADAASPAATVSTPTETAVTPAAVAAPPAETAVTPPADAAAPVATVSTPSETVSTPAARPQRLSKTPAAVATMPAVTASTSSETASTPAAAATTPAAPASTSSETASTPVAAATTPAAPAKRGALWLLIALGVLVIVIGTLAPLLSRWRKRKFLERTGAPNLSFTREASSDPDKPEQPRKAA